MNVITGLAQIIFALFAMFFVVTTLLALLSWLSGDNDGVAKVARAVDGAIKTADSNQEAMHLYRTGKITKAEFDKRFKKIGSNRYQ